MSLLTRTDQKFLSLALASLWKLIPGLAGLSCKSNAVVLTAFCSSPVRRARLSVKVSAMRKSIIAVASVLLHACASIPRSLHLLKRSALLFFRQINLASQQDSLSLHKNLDSVLQSSRRSVPRAVPQTFGSGHYLRSKGSSILRSTGP